MGFLSALAKPFKAIYNQAKLLKDIVAVLFYFALLAGVIIGAISAPLPSVVTIPLASVLSFLIAFIAHKSFRRLSSHFVEQNDETALALKLQEAQNQLKREKEEHQRALDQLVQENRDLKNQMDTSEQTRNAYGKIDFCAEITIAKPQHKDYIVKKESLQTLLHIPEYAEILPGQGFWESSESYQSREVLFIHKIHHRDAIGFNLANIEFAVGTDGHIYMKGVDCKVLEHLKADDIPGTDICWVVSDKGDGNIKVKTSESFDKFKNLYKTQQTKLYEESLSENNEHQAALITTRLHTMLMEKYPNLKFVSTREEAPAGLIWSSLSSNTGSIAVMEVVIQMLSGMNTMKQIAE